MYEIQYQYIERNKKREKTQEEFAEAIGITRELYNKIESGKLSISKSTEVLLDNYLEGKGKIVDTLRRPEDEEIIQGLYERVKLLEDKIRYLEREAERTQV